MTARIGFAGLGLMGHGMASNLLEKGFPLTVLAHRKREAVEDLVGLRQVFEHVPEGQTNRKKTGG